MYPLHPAPTANGYRIDFRADGAEEDVFYLTLDFDFIEPMAWGLLTTLTVRTTLPTLNPMPDDVILLSRLNLLKESEREAVAKRLDVLIQHPDGRTPQDWRRHLEWSMVALNAAIQRPVPTEDLTGYVPTERRKFLIDGFLADGKANILYGPGGSGKSMLAVRTAAAVGFDETLLGMPVRDHGRTLYLDWEDDITTMVERMHMVAKGMNLRESIPISYKSLHGRGPYERHHADVLFNVKRSDDIRLVIFDSTAMAMHGSSQDGAEGAIRFYALVSQLPATVLLLDHISSDDMKNPHGSAKPYGSVFKVNSARNVWEHRPWNPNAGATGFTLVHRKTNVGPYLPDRDVSIAWSDDEVRFVKV